MTLRRRFLTWWRGPLCDAGTAFGAEGCLKTATFTTIGHPPTWSRGFRWCEEHQAAAGDAIGLPLRPKDPTP